jgi:hypothetical protein
MKLQVLTAVSYGTFILTGLLLTGAAALSIYDWRLRRRLRGTLVCQACEYNLEGHARLESGKTNLMRADRFNCPECGADLRFDGAVVSKSVAEARRSRRSGLAGLALLFGAFTCCAIHRAVRKDALAEVARFAGGSFPASGWRDWLLVGLTLGLTIWILAVWVQVRRGRTAT